MNSLRLIILLVLSILFLGACSADAASATPTPFPFTTATPRPTSTVPAPTIPAVPTETDVLPPTETSEVLPLTDSSSTSAPDQPVTPPPMLVPVDTPSGDLVLVERRCPHRLTGDMLRLYTGEPGIQAAFGCPISPNEDTPIQQWYAQTRYQPFERGAVLWMSERAWEDTALLIVLRDNSIYTRHADEFTGTAISTGTPGTLTAEATIVPGPNSVPTAPAGLLEPDGAIGWLWRNESGLFQQIGYATQPAIEMDSEVLILEFGDIIALPAEGIAIALRRGNPGAWSRYSLP